MSAPVPGAGLADDAEQWLAGLTAVGEIGSLGSGMQRLVGDWVAQVQAVPVAVIVAGLDEAEALLEQHGWVQGRYGSVDTGFSVAGAIEEVGYRSGWRPERGATLCVRTVLVLRGRGSSLSEWNDDLRRDEADVTALLAEARELARRIGGDR
ncbi:DUF6197 family protein [Streptomyces sp. XC 2026]|uniref:DUF6197 family protein n=1 Tax=Streptomyces sp. XC 2026 TaxID=2782004 RepID=UPI001905E509|nr:hypothetical protein [Streptomyces sp. XC 2026]QQN79744.1 hypothetical protein IPZ77_21700 [Streptomyces sp. XC 2026]QQN80648.1 hypothetical protein IPZ77_26955 [Streptomyces sp. XC 2026]